MPLPDIFLSYNREDQATARRFAEAFGSAGFDVWWDVSLRSGEAYDEVTETALRTAKAVVVLWSRKSVVSRWVRAEATLADRNKTLLPVMIEPCERPIMFELTQTAELSHWTGDGEDGAWQAFLGDVRRFLSGAPMPAAQVTAPAAVASAPPGQESSRRPSLAVLPFGHAHDDDDLAMFAEALAEDLIAGLSRSRLVAVKPRQSSLTYEAERRTAPQVCADLGVDYAVQGRIRRLGSRLRLSAELVSGADNANLWSTRHDCVIEDPVDLLEEMAVAIVGAIEPAVMDNEQALCARRSSRQSGHWELFVRGRRLFWRSTYADMKEAEALFERALELEPDDASTLSLLSHCHMFYVWAGVTRDLPAEIARSHDLALRAVASDAADSFAHFSLGVTLEMLRRTDEARAEFLRALQLNPFQAAAAGMLGRLAAFAGDMETADSWSQKAVAISPNDPHLFIWRLSKAAAAFAVQDHPGTVSAALETVAHAPYLFGNHFMLAAAYAANGQLEPARQAFEAGRRIKSRYSQEAMEITFPFTRGADAARFSDALRAAGWTG